MDIVTAIISLLGGLAMFLYGIEVMGDGLKNSSGAALKKVLEKEEQLQDMQLVAKQVHLNLAKAIQKKDMLLHLLE